MTLHTTAAYRMSLGTCPIASHSVICHPTQVKTPCLNSSQRPVLDLPTPEGQKAELT